MQQHVFIDLLRKIHNNPASDHITTSLRDQCVFDNNRYNINLWLQEDLCRDVYNNPPFDPMVIVNAKKDIDRLNQARNNAMEGIDREFLLMYDREVVGTRVSETLGQMCDRASILYLKLKHAVNIAKATALASQYEDVLDSINSLVNGYEQGTHYFKRYGQYKQYGNQFGDRCS